MENSIYHQTYGTITYKEGLWSGKKSIWINNQELEKIDKKAYRYNNGAESFVVEVRGSSVTGVVLDVKGEKIQVIEKTAWYVLALSALMFALIFFGGAIGGLVGAGFAIAYITVSKTIKNVWLRVLAGILFAVAAWLIYYVLAVVLLNFIH